MDAYTLDTDIYDALKTLTAKPAFHGIRIEDMIPLVKNGRRRSFPARTTVVEHGRRSESLYLVLHGKVRIERTFGLERPQFLAEVGPGDFIGEMGTFTGVARSATAFALEPVDTLEMSEHDLQRVLRHDHPFMVALVKLMNDRYRRL